MKKTNLGVSLIRLIVPKGDRFSRTKRPKKKFINAR
jgi:hypothetical protein